MNSPIIDKQLGLISAAENGRIADVKKYLNDDTVNVNWNYDYEYTALHWACRNGHRNIAELLMR